MQNQTPDEVGTEVYNPTSTVSYAADAQYPKRLNVAYSCKRMDRTLSWLQAWPLHDFRLRGKQAKSKVEQHIRN